MNEEDFNITLKLSSSKIHITAKKKNSYFIYQNDFNLEDLKKLSKMLLVYDSVKDIYNCIKTISDKGNGKICFENEKFIFSIPIFLPSGNQEFIKFALNQSKLEKDEIIEHLGKRIEELENTILVFKENFNDILKRLQILENEKKEREEKEREKEKLLAIKDILESSICKENEISFFVEELKKHEKFMNKIIKFKLLFKATRDGDKLNIIHNKCDYKSVLILIKTKKDVRFGGYSKVGFNDKGPELNDRNAFIFFWIKK